MSLIHELKTSFKKGTATTKIIYINLALFVIVRLSTVVYYLFSYSYDFSMALALPADLSQLAYKPWTVVSYMFLHYDFMHILFNMLWLYWMGEIFLRYFDKSKLIGLYILGGLAGGLLYLLAYNSLDVFSGRLPNAHLLGASASVLAIITALASYAPNHRIRLMFIGEIKILHLAVVSVIIYLLSINVSNPGGNIAHLGGALSGYIFVLLYQKGIDCTKWMFSIYNYFKSLFSRKTIRVTHRQTKGGNYEYAQKKRDNQEEINRILEKIRTSGYNSLSKEEKKALFKMNK